MRALLSVSDKTGLVEFAKGLVEQGFEIVSTGGTYKTLTEAGIAAIYIQDVTGFPEILDGRVKTLHPNIHGGILARRNEEHLGQLAKLNIVPIDLVAVNLYPFKAAVETAGVTLAEAIEKIDIGGPSMVRSAAKNHESVIVVVNPLHYPAILEKLRTGEMDADFRRKLAFEAFSHTAAYDAAISSYLGSLEKEPPEEFAEDLIIAAAKVAELRYGENPHQHAAFYRNLRAPQGTMGAAKQMQGKELSFNNILDADAAFKIALEFKEFPACSIIKHNNPCGVALGDTMAEAFARALEADTISAYGGIVGFNGVVTKEAAALIVEGFFEAVIAPEFDPDALEIFKAKKNLRILEAGYPLKREPFPYEIKKVGGGFLLQDSDCRALTDDDLKLAAGKEYDMETLSEMHFAWRVVKHVKSNAIIVTKDKQVLGVGAGQMNRVGSARIALAQAGEKAKGAVLASDAFFPFKDTVELAADAGIKAIIQTGGSTRDEEVVQEARARNIVMVLTGVRHFKH